MMLLPIPFPLYAVGMANECYARYAPREHAGVQGALYEPMVDYVQEIVFCDVR